LLLALPALGQAGAAPKSDPADQAFLVARDAFRAGDSVKLSRAAPRTKGHVLEPYVQQWQLRLHLDEARTEAVQAFLRAHEGSLPAEQLRAEWLKLLGRKGQWDEFREERPRLANEDTDILCYGLLHRWRSGDLSAAADLKRVWTSPQELPLGCSALAEQLLQSGRYASHEIWQRFRVLAGAGRIPAAKKLLERLPERETPRSKSIDYALNSPMKHLLQLSGALATRPAKELALLALSRIAKHEPQLAAEQFTAGLREQFAAEEQGYVWGQIATAAARRHMPEALEWFIAAGDAELSDEQRAWHLRSALRADDWEQVLAAVERMSLQARIETAWTYWRARALKALGRVEQASPLFGLISGEYNFYGRLAAEELELPFALPPRPAPATDAELARILSVPGIQRSLALFRLEMRTEAVREWNWSIRGMEDRDLILAAEVARRHEIWDRTINTADRTVALHDFSLRYPAPHREIFTNHARARSLEEHWVLGLVRQESRFISAARSSAGAAGLMQLMPATARWVAKKMGMKNFSWARVNSVDVNAALGTYYLRQVLDDLNGQHILAAAAYNAGPGRARRWMGSRPMEGAVYIETIPFNETRDYVKKVMVNTLYYAAVHGGEPGSLKARLGTVGQRAIFAATDTP
jgi:soluble lytic murein transglycosylase